MSLNEQPGGEPGADRDDTTSNGSAASLASDTVDAPRGDRITVAGVRVLGVDLGTRRIGLAICDSGQTVATPHGTIQRLDNRVLEHEELDAVVSDTGAGLLVVGLPLSLEDGSLGPAAKAVLAEVKSMRKNLDVPVDTWDERFTTVEAERSQRQMGMRSKKKRATVDQLAATVILQSWLDFAGGS